MAQNYKLIKEYPAPVVTAITGAAPQTVEGPSVLMLNVEKSLSATVYAKATTNALALTAKWQVSNDNVSWTEIKVPNNASNVALVTGTGSAVTSTVVLSAPDGVYGKKHARLVVVSSGGTGAGLGADEASIAYNYVGNLMASAN